MKKHNSSTLTFEDAIECLQIRNYDHTVKRYDWTWPGSIRSLYDDCAKTDEQKEQFIKEFEAALDRHLDEIDGEEKNLFINAVVDEFNKYPQFAKILLRIQKTVSA